MKKCFLYAMPILVFVASILAWSKPARASKKIYAHYLVARENAVGKMAIPKLSPKVLWRGTITFKVESFAAARSKALLLAQKYAGTSYSEQVHVASNGRNRLLFPELVELHRAAANKIKAV